MGNINLYNDAGYRRDFFYVSEHDDLIRCEIFYNNPIGSRGHNQKLTNNKKYKDFSQ